MSAVVEAQRVKRAQQEELEAILKPLDGTAARLFLSAQVAVLSTYRRAGFVSAKAHAESIVEAYEDAALSKALAA